MGRLTVRLSRRIAIEDGVAVANDVDGVARYDEMTGVALGGGELTGVVVSAFLFTPFFVYIQHSML